MRLVKTRGRSVFEEHLRKKIINNAVGDERESERTLSDFLTRIHASFKRLTAVIIEKKNISKEKIDRSARGQVRDDAEGIPNWTYDDDDDVISKTTRGRRSTRTKRYETRERVRPVWFVGRLLPIIYIYVYAWASKVRRTVKIIIVIMHTRYSRMVKGGGGGIHTTPVNERFNFFFLLLL